ncbi:MAG: hypothetical protein NVS9B14_15170 [Candidatus Acidiferrum sp.]
MLYCPKCGAEYRDGYSSCSDCHVSLVSERPQAGTGRSGEAPDPGDPNRDPFCGFWRGDDPRIHAELCSVLEEAGIPHKTVYRKDHLFNLSNNHTFQVGVPASRFEEAEDAIRSAFSSDVDDSDAAEFLTTPQLLPDRTNRIRKLPEMLAPSENIPGPMSSADSEDWSREDATALVWSGDDEYLGGAILASLNENDLHVRREIEAANSRLFVFPVEEARAREIIQEIVEVRPPE